MALKELLWWSASTLVNETSLYGIERSKALCLEAFTRENDTCFCLFLVAAVVCNAQTASDSSALCLPGCHSNHVIVSYYVTFKSYACGGFIFLGVVIL